MPSVVQQPPWAKRPYHFRTRRSTLYSSIPTAVLPGTKLAHETTPLLDRLDRGYSRALRGNCRRSTERGDDYFG